jgi:hypothetical protein
MSHSFSEGDRVRWHWTEGEHQSNYREAEIVGFGNLYDYVIRFDDGHTLHCFSHELVPAPTTAELN